MQRRSHLYVCALPIHQPLCQVRGTRKERAVRESEVPAKGMNQIQVWHLHQQGVDSETPRGRMRQVRETSRRCCNQSLHARRELLKTPKVRAFNVHPIQAPLPP